MTFEKPLSMLYNWRGSRALCDHSFIYDIQKKLTYQNILLSLMKYLYFLIKQLYPPNEQK